MHFQFVYQILKDVVLKDFYIIFRRIFILKKKQFGYL
jgi:hypothetical protein